MKRTLSATLCGALILAAPAVAEQLDVLPPAPAVPAAPSRATLEMLDALRAAAHARAAGQDAALANLVAEALQQPAKPAAAPAQPAPPGTAAPPAPPGTFPASPPSSRRARNIRFDITITDVGGPKPVTKVVSLTVSDNGASGSIRNMARLPGAPVGFQPGPDGPATIVPMSAQGSFPLNVDVRSVVFDETGVRASIIVEYQPYVPDAKIQPGVINASSNAVFVDGVRTQILQASDPLTDRRTTIEVMATVLK